MTIDQQGLNFTKTFEGFSPMPYQDVAGIWTVGYGHKVLPHQDYSSGITIQQAETILYDDMEPVEEKVLQLAPQCNQRQLNALCDFGFNLGIGSLEQLLAHGFEQVPYQLYRRDADGTEHGWIFAKVNGVETKIAGLVRRRQAELELFNS